MQRPSNTFDWYALYTYPNSEKKVNNYLLKKGIETFLPLQQIRRQWSDRKKTLQVPLFPNYIFVHINRVYRHMALHVPGVVRFVTFENKPVSVHENTINTIKKLTNGTDNLSIEHFLLEGDHVRVIHGPYTGLTGILFQRRGKQRIGVKILTIAQSLSVEMTSSCVQKIAT